MGRIQPAFAVGPGQAQQCGRQRRQVAGHVRRAQPAQRQRPARAADDRMELAVALEQLDEHAAVEPGGQLRRPQPARTAEPGSRPGPAAIAELLLGAPQPPAEAHELPRPGVGVAQLDVERTDVSDDPGAGGVGPGPGRGTGQRPGPPAVGPAQDVGRPAGGQRQRRAEGGQIRAVRRGRRLELCRAERIGVLLDDAHPGPDGPPRPGQVAGERPELCLRIPGLDPVGHGSPPASRGHLVEEVAGAADLARPQLEQRQHDQGLVGLRRPPGRGQPPGDAVGLPAVLGVDRDCGVGRAHAERHVLGVRRPAGSPRPPEGGACPLGRRECLAGRAGAEQCGGEQQRGLGLGDGAAVAGGQRLGPGRRLGGLLREPSQQEALGPVPLQVDEGPPRRRQLLQPPSGVRERRQRSRDLAPPGVDEGQVVEDGRRHQPLVEGIGQRGRGPEIGLGRRELSGLQPDDAPVDQGPGLGQPVAVGHRGGDRPVGGLARLPEPAGVEEDQAALGQEAGPSIDVDVGRRGPQLGQRRRGPAHLGQRQRQADPEAGDEGPVGALHRRVRGQVDGPPQGRHRSLGVAHLQLRAPGRPLVHRPCRRRPLRVAAVAVGHGQRLDGIPLHQDVHGGDRPTDRRRRWTQGVGCIRHALRSLYCPGRFEHRRRRCPVRTPRGTTVSASTWTRPGATSPSVPTR